MRISARKLLVILLTVLLLITSCSNASYGGNDNRIVADVTPPIITEVDVVKINPTGVTVIWETDEFADSHIEYGTTEMYGTSQSLLRTIVTGHGVKLEWLTPETTYHFRVKSQDASGNQTTSDDYTFTTRKEYLEVDIMPHLTNP